MKNRLIILVIFIAVLTACKGMKDITHTIPEEKTDQKIIFHQFKAKALNGIITIEELERVLRDGQIKELNSQPGVMDHPVEVIFLDKSGKKIKSTYIENPLIKEYEYADDGGNLKRIVSYEDSTIFTIRYNLIDNLHSMNFSSVSNDTLHIQVHLKLEK